MMPLMTSLPVLSPLPLSGSVLSPLSRRGHHQWGHEGWRTALRSTRLSLELLHQCGEAPVTTT